MADPTRILYCHCAYARIVPAETKTEVLTRDPRRRPPIPHREGTLHDRLDTSDRVVEAADGLPVLFDSGIRSGADVIKALALGATAVGVGRPYAYALALGGVDGIVHVLRTLLAEADLIMAVDGYPTLKDLTPDTLRRVE